MTDTITTLEFTATSAFSIDGVFGALAFAYVGLMKLLPKTASRTDRVTFLWLVSNLNLNLANAYALSQKIERLMKFCLRHSTR